MRRKFSKNLFFWNLNVNSVTNEFEASELIIKDKSDVSLVKECKFDLSFPETQFKIPGDNFFCQDRDSWFNFLY